VKAFLLKHKGKALAVAAAAAYAGLGVYTGDMDWTTAVTKFFALAGLGVI
jgi:hypothetical protein